MISDKTPELIKDLGMSAAEAISTLKNGSLQEAMDIIKPLLSVAGMDEKQTTAFMHQVFLFRQDPTYIPNFEELGKYMDWVNKIFSLVEVVSDNSLTTDQKAEALQDPVYEIVADLIINKSPLAVVANLPLIGPIFSMGLKKGGKITGDYVGGKLDNFVDYVMTKTGGKQYIINHKKEIQTFFGLSPKQNPTYKIIPDTIVPKSNQLNTRSQSIKQVIGIA